MSIYWPGNISLSQPGYCESGGGKAPSLLFCTVLENSIQMGPIHLASPRAWPCYLIHRLVEGYRSGRLWARVGKCVSDYIGSQWPSCHRPSTLHCHWLQSKGAGWTCRKDGEGDQKPEIPVSKNHGTLKNPILLNMKCGWKRKHIARLSQKKKKGTLKNMKTQKTKLK